MKYQQLTRLFVANFLKEDEIILSSLPDIHYLVKVMRKRIKDQLLIFNNRNGEYLVEIADINAKKITFKIIEHVRLPKPEREINLVFAPIKQARIGFLLEKATELGATKLIPIQTKHSVVDKVNQTKWQIYVKEAAEQCGRLSIPEITDLVSLDRFLTDWPNSKSIILCNEKEKLLSLSQHLLNLDQADAVTIMIGPEGGFSSQELLMLTSKDYITSVHLGERILRAETATLVGLALVDGVGNFLKS